MAPPERNKLKRLLQRRAGILSAHCLQAALVLRRFDF